MDSGEQASRILDAAVSQRPCPLPDIADILFVALIGWIVFCLPNYVLGDGSTGWHLLTGKYIIEHGQIPNHDLFSYTFPDRSWVPYEWLADVVAYGLVALGGLKLLAVTTAGAIALLFALIYRCCRQYHCHFSIAAGLTLLGILISSVHWLARPHLFTFFGLFIFCSQLEAFRRGEQLLKALVLWLALTMLIWSNAHPAFLVGLSVTCIYLVSEFIGWAFLAGSEKTSAGKRLLGFALTFAVVSASTLVNPNVAHMYAYIANYLHSSSVLAATDEFMPPNFHDLHAALLALLFALFVFALAISRKRPALAQVLLVLAFAWLALNSRRNEPLFVIVSIPVIADLLSSLNVGLLFGNGVSAPAAWWQKLQNFWSGCGKTVDEMESVCTLHLMPILLTGLLVSACLFNGKIGPLQLVSSDFGADSKPTETLKYAQTHNLNFNRAFSLDNWGGYIAYVTGQRVFIDDRLDFYGEPFFLQYGEIVQAKPNWEQLLRQNKIEWVLFPKNSALSQALQKSPQWVLLSQDPAAVLYARKH